MSPNRFSIVGGKAFALIQISNIFFVFSCIRIRTDAHGERIVVRLVSDVKMKHIGEDYGRKNAVSVPRHVIYCCCVAPSLDPPIGGRSDGCV
jgi:hypothetical protein